MGIKFWIMALGLSIAAGILGILGLCQTHRTKTRRDGAVELLFSAVLLFIISSVGVTSYVRHSPPAELFLEDSGTTMADYEKIYREFCSNFNQASDEFSGRRYRMISTIQNMGFSQQAYDDCGSCVNMEVKTNGETVGLHCKFTTYGQEQLAWCKPGDTVIFEGTCITAQEWEACELCSVIRV